MGKNFLKYFFMTVGVIVCLPIIFKVLAALVGTAFGILGFFIKGAVYALFFWIVFRMFKNTREKDKGEQEHDDVIKDSFDNNNSRKDVTNSTDNE